MHCTKQYYIYINSKIHDNVMHPSEVNMTTLTGKQSKIHSCALKLARIHAKAERSLVKTLIQVESEKIHKRLGRRSMFLYATLELKLSEAVAFALIAVARKAKELPVLREAIAEGRLSPSKASRVVAHINSENAEEVVDFACTHSQREIDFEMARRNPKASARDRVKPITADDVQLTCTVSKNVYADLQRAQSLLAQKGKPATLGGAIEAALELYLNTQDPVRKAKRAQAK
jgi:hypothetical protein